MTAQVIPLRPRSRPGGRPRPVLARPARPASSRAVPDPQVPVSVEWDEGRALYVGICHRCTDTITTVRLDQAHEWAETHTCDPELAQLLTEITGSAA